MSKLRVALTGGIGSGKSAAADYLRSLGVPVFDADQVAREMVTPESPALNAIAEHFGQDIILANGNLDRKALRKIVFDDPSQRRWLEQLLHPLINSRLEELMSKNQYAYSVLETPVLFEAGQDKLVDRVLLIDALDNLRITRASRRDNSNEADVRRIMAAQMSRQELLSRADDIIENNASLEELQNSILKLHHEYLRIQGRDRG